MMAFDPVILFHVGAPSCSCQLYEELSRHFTILGAEWFETRHSLFSTSEVHSLFRVIPLACRALQQLGGSEGHLSPSEASNVNNFYRFHSLLPQGALSHARLGFDTTCSGGAGSAILCSDEPYTNNVDPSSFVLSAQDRSCADYPDSRTKALYAGNTCLAKSTPLKRPLVLACLTPAYSRGLKRYMGHLSALFPGVRQWAILSFSDHESMFNEIYALSRILGAKGKIGRSTPGSIDRFFSYYRAKAPRMNLVVKRVRKLFEQAQIISLVSSGDGSAPDKCIPAQTLADLVQFIQGASASKDEGASGVNDTPRHDLLSQKNALPCVSPFTLQRSAIEFMEVVNECCGFEATSATSFWLENSLFLQNAQERDASATFLSSRQQAALAERFGTSFLKAAVPDLSGRKISGQQHSLPDENARITSRSPSPPMTEETAYTYAHCLDASAVETCVKYLAKKEQENLPYEHQICLRGFESALTPVRKTTAVYRPAPLSVLTATYNHVEYIEKNIQSVLEQKTSFRFWHIIADDGSDDGTREIIRAYAKKYPHILPVFQPARSHGKANIRALFTMARTPYVALCEGDDFFEHPHKLQLQVEFLDAHEECALCFHPVHILEKDGSRSLFPTLRQFPFLKGKTTFTLADLFRANFIQTNSVMYRWRFVGGLPEWFRSDVMPADWYWHILHAENGQIGFIDNPMSCYRRHEASLWNTAYADIQKHNAEWSDALLRLCEELQGHFDGKHDRAVQRNAYFVLDCLHQHSRRSGDDRFLAAALRKFPEYEKLYTSPPLHIRLQRLKQALKAHLKRRSG